MGIHTCRALSALFLSLPLLLTTAEGKMLVGICFFGLTRSLRLTYQSIYGNLLQPLRDAGFEYDIFMHTYLVGTMYNPRSGEVNTTMDYGEWALLSPSSLLIEKQSSVDEKLFVDMEAYTKRGDPWHNNYISLKNLLRQLHSLEMVTQLVTQSRTVYDVLIFARPDVIYFNRINASQIIEAVQNPKLIYVPSFHAWGGINDRFGFGSYSAMLPYGRRGRWAKEYCQTHNLHSEHFVQYVLKTNGLDIRKTDIYFGRVRANGVLWEYPARTKGGEIRINRCTKKGFCPQNLTSIALDLGLDAAATRPHAVTAAELAAIHEGRRIATEKHKAADYKAPKAKAAKGAKPAGEHFRGKI